MIRKGNRKLIHLKVQKEAPVSLLSGRASEALELIHFDQQHLVNAVNSSTVLTKEEVLNTYRDVFKGLGQLPGVYHTEMDPSVTPV